MRRMHRSLRIPDPTRTHKQLLIMRLITSIGLSLLLLFSVAATTGHTDTQNGEKVPFAMTEFDGAGVDPSTQQIVTVPGDVNASLGVALCALGILCGLTAIILVLRLFWSPQLASPLRAGPRPLARASVFTSPLRTTALSLTQLGLSRT